LVNARRVCRLSLNPAGTVEPTTATVVSLRVVRYVSAESS
jgi:hypothetical protein